MNAEAVGVHRNYFIEGNNISHIYKYPATVADTSIVLYYGRVPAANAPGCTAAEGLLYEPWSLVVPTCTARCLHQRP